MKRTIAIWLVWSMVLGLLSPGFGSVAFAYGQEGQGGSVSSSVYESVYKEIGLAADADAYIQRGSRDTNYGFSATLGVRWQNSKGSGNQNSYLTFDLSRLTRLDDHSVAEAKLRLYLDSITASGSNRMRVSSVDSSWSEAAISWSNTVPDENGSLAVNQAAGASALFNIVLPESAGQWVEINLTDYINSQLALDRKIFSLELSAIDGFTAKFGSREGANPPELALRLYGPELLSLQVEQQPLKTVYYMGEALEEAGLAVNGTYSDGVTVPLTHYRLSGFDSSAPAENQLVTLSAEGKTAGFAVRILPPELVAVEIARLPDKLVYNVGDAPDWTGLEVTGRYINGASAALASDQYQLSGFDSSAPAADQTITVSSEGKTAQFSIQILKMLELQVLPEADAYTLVSRATTNYGSWDLLATKWDNSNSTTRKIYMKYDMSGLHIRDPQSIVSVAIQAYRTDANKTSGSVGVYAVSDHTWEEGTITWDNAPAHAATPLTVAAVGPENRFYEFDITSYVKEHWQEKTLSFVLLGQVHNQQMDFISKEPKAADAGKEPRLVLRTVQAPLTAIEIADLPAKTVYYPGEELDLTGLTVTGHYEDGSAYPITGYTVSGFDSYAPSVNQPITVTAEGKTAVFHVEVRPPSGVNPPSWPEGSVLAASVVSKTRVMLSWPAAADNEDVTGYRLFANDSLIATMDGQTLSYSLRGLAPSTRYLFRIEAGDGQGNWTAGPELEVFTELNPPDLPQVDAIESGAFDMADWTVAVNSDGKGVWETVDGNLALTAYASSGSQPLRNVAVYKTPLIGDFVWTGKVAVTPRGDWDDLAVVFNYIDEENYCFVSLNKSNDGATHGIFRVVNNSMIQLSDFELGLLRPGTVQDLRIDRVGAIVKVYLDGDFIGEAEEGQYTNGKVGFGSGNDRVTLSGMAMYGQELIDLAPPGAPGGLAAEAQSSTAVRLSWEPSSDDSGIKLYSVYRDGQLLGTTNLIGYVDEGLEPASVYSYYVTATDVVNKVSEPSRTVSATTLAKDPYAFPFRHSLIDSALREPLLQYQLSLEWTSHSLRSGTALMYLMAASMYDPYYKGSDGTVIKDRILAHFRNMLVPGSRREPGASGSLDTSATALAIQAFDMASTIPAIWDELTQEEKDKITLIMQAHLVAAHWGHDDENSFSTGIDQLGNFNKGWNPNYVEGAIANALAAVRYLGGAEAANAFLLSFDYDSFMSKLQAAGLSSIAWTFRQTGKTALEKAVKNEFTYRGHKLDDPFGWIKERALVMYGKTVKAQVYSGDTLRAYVNDPEGLPNIGALGMAHEFDTVDAEGVRSDLDYATRGWNNSILSLMTAYYYGVPQSAEQPDVELIQSRYAVGSTDLIYKATHGYYGYAKGKSLGFRDAFTADANLGYDWLKDLWENVIGRPDLIPLRDMDPPEAPDSLQGQWSESGVKLAWTAASDNNRVAGYRIYRNGLEIGQTDGNTLAYIDAAPLVGGADYTVAAYDAAGNRSSVSKAVTVRRSSGGDASSSSGSSAAPGIKAGITVNGTDSSLNADVQILQGTAVVKLPAELWAKLLPDNAEASLLTLTIPEQKGISAYVLQLPGFQSGNEASPGRLVLETPLGALDAGGLFLRELAGGSGKKADIELSVAAAEKAALAEGIRQALGGRPLIRVEAKVNGKPWANGGNTKLAVSVPYAPSAAEQARYEKLAVRTLLEDGRMMPVFNGAYDHALGAMTFSVTESGLYGIVFGEKSFADLTAAEWSRTAVEVLAAKGIIDGTAPDAYSPSAAVTRADFTALLVKTLGFAGPAESGFADISRAHLHYRELALAEKLGIVQGSGGNRFEPSAPITRQDMMVLTARALEAAESLGGGGASAEAGLAAFADGGQVAEYAQESAAALVGMGLIQGADGRLQPLSNLTRAEAAVLLYRIYARIG